MFISPQLVVVKVPGCRRMLSDSIFMTVSVQLGIFLVTSSLTLMSTKLQLPCQLLRQMMGLKTALRYVVPSELVNVHT